MKRKGFAVTIVVSAGLAAAVVTPAGAPQLSRAVFHGFDRFGPEIHNLAYDGRFTFARIKYESRPGGDYFYGIPAWAHGYLTIDGGERSEENLMKITQEISMLDSSPERTVVVALDDPELSRYPLAYMAEPGWWTLNDREAAGLRSYLLKGGFIIFDDFRDDGRMFTGQWENFERNIRKAFPGALLFDLDPSNPVFHSFFEVNEETLPNAYDVGRPMIRGLFEDNDPSKRLMAVANYNSDISQFWQFSATGFRPVSESNEAYKLGVNYVIYGMTH
jgi:Domain of unknown function (DUF4159)